MASEAHQADHDFWGLPLESAPQRLDELMHGAEPGLRVWAPAVVALDARTSLPVHVGVLERLETLQQLAFVERAIVVGVDVATGETRAVRVAGQQGRTRLPPPPGFEGGLGPGSGAVAAEVTRRMLWDSRSEAAWPPGRVRLTVIAADRVSNDVRVDITRSTLTIDPAATAAAARAAAQVSPSPDPTGGLPRYDAVEGGLAPPPVPGVVLAAERVVKARAGSVCVLSGALRAPADTSLAGRSPLLAVTLVITGSEDPGPHVVAMRVPSFERDATGVTARFAVDLFRLAPLAASAQTYFVYAFTVDGHWGPLPLAVVPD